MKLFIGLIIVLCIVSLTRTQISPHIIGGQNATEGKYPYQVSLRGKYSHVCGGSILNKRWILTAAHCVNNLKNATLLAVVGTIIINDGSGDTYNMEHVVWHPKYSKDGVTNDVGLIRVDRDIEFSDKVQPIGLPVKDFKKKDYPAVLTGWGHIAIGVTTNILQEIQLKVISQEECISKVNYPISNAHICTLSQAGEGACFGDSGGPLVADGVQIGIVSFGYACARGKPDVFARVFTFLDWINEQQNKF